MLKSYKMSFQGELLQRGFWLYVWDINGGNSRHLYVGRTGDSSSPNASSPFRRIGQHLDSKTTAKGNALARRLKEANIDSACCTFDMIAIGPIYEEQSTMDAHRPLRDRISALERALADELRGRGYQVLGTHGAAEPTEMNLLADVMELIDDSLPPIRLVQ